jgi:hypothetical protein
MPDSLSWRYTSKIRTWERQRLLPNPLTEGRKNQ